MTDERLMASLFLQESGVFPDLMEIDSIAQYVSPGNVTTLKVDAIISDVTSNFENLPSEVRRCLTRQEAEKKRFNILHNHYT